MCGRYVSSSPPDELARYFDAGPVTDRDLEPSWNVAPTDEVFVVRDKRGTRSLDTFRWGLVPAWADGPKIGSRFINARCETLTDSNAFRPAFERRRCLIPADGFYEWQKTGPKARQPHFIRRPDGEPYAFAGLWERWRPRGDESEQTVLHTCTIITGPANPVVAGIHDRMPVMLPPGAWDCWLDPSVSDHARLNSLLVPAGEAWTVMHPVASTVNSSRNQGPGLILAVDPTDTANPPGPVQGTLL